MCLSWTFPLLAGWFPLRATLHILRASSGMWCSLPECQKITIVFSWLEYESAPSTPQRSDKLHEVLLPLCNSHLVCLTPPSVLFRLSLQLGLLCSWFLHRRPRALDVWHLVIGIAQLWGSLLFFLFSWMSEGSVTCFYSAGPFIFPLSGLCRFCSFPLAIYLEGFFEFTFVT